MNINNNNYYFLLKKHAHNHKITYVSKKEKENPQNHSHVSMRFYARHVVRFGLLLGSQHLLRTTMLVMMIIK